MKHIRFSLMPALVLGSVMAASVFAQEPAKPAAPAAPTPPPAISGATNATTTRPMMRDRTDFLAQNLKLTDEQKEKIRPVIDAENLKIAEIRKNKDITPQDRNAEYMKIREETGTKIKPILNADQWERYSKTFLRRPSTNAPGMMIRPAAPAAPAVPSAPATPAK